MRHWNNFTTDEMARLWRHAGNQDIAEVYERLSEIEKELEEFEKENEVRLEQSEFRRALIAQIMEICVLEGTKEGLVNAIKTAFENSYVEL